MSVFGFCTLLRKFAKAYLLKLLVQLLDLLFHDLCMSFLSFASQCINVTLIYIGKVVLHKLEIRLDWLVEKPFINSHGRGIYSSRIGRWSSSVCNPVAGTIAPPIPEPSPGGLSMALETTADNLYFQVSAGVMPITPK